MKKIMVFLALFMVLAAGVHAETEIIDWQNSEEGVDAEPAWLSDFLGTRNDSSLRKFFSLGKNDEFFLGIADADSMDKAMGLAKTKSTAIAEKRLGKEIPADEQRKNVRISGLEQRWFFWQQISKDGGEPFYRAYFLQSASKKNWAMLVDQYARK